MTAIKKITAILISAVLAISAFAYLPTSFSYGEVSKDTSWFDDDKRLDSYNITTEEQLIGLASLVNEEQVEKWKKTRIENFEGVTFNLMRDIKLTKKWEPIGYDSASHFSGIFNGNGHTITGLKVEQTIDNAGLFGYLTGEVRNLTVEGTVNGSASNIGGIAGYLDSSAKIANCISKVNVTGDEKVGGIAGYNYGGSIEGCVNLGKVKGSLKVGGIVGENWGGDIAQCGNEGKIVSTSRGVATYGTGGIAGRSVSGTSSITECYNIGTIESDTEATGGIVGYTNAAGALIKSSYNSGKIRIMNKEKVNTHIATCAGGIAGIVGMKGIVIENCYNTGQIADAKVLGGVIGKYLNDDDTTDSYIHNNYYVKSLFNQGIGQASEPKTDEVDKAAKGTGDNITALSSSLGASFTSGISNSYNNNGAPVLKWQKPVTESEKVYSAKISIDIQKKLDKILVKNAKKEIYGKCILNAFNTNNITSGASAMYGEIKDSLLDVKSIEKKISDKKTTDKKATDDKE